MALLDELLIRVVVDATGASRQIDQVTHKTDELAGSAEDAAKSIDKQVKALELQARTAGMSKKEATLYKLAQEGATKADLDRAKAAIEASEAVEAQSKSVAGLAAKLAGALVAGLSVGATISGVLSRATEIGELQRTSEALNIAIGDLDAFGKAAERAGGDAQGARDSLTDMAEALGEALSDKESGRAKAFKALGIAITDTNGKAKDGLTGLLDLASAVEGLDRSAAVFKIKELGITDNRTVELILKGRKELERMLAVQKAQGVVTKEAAERAKVFNDALFALRGSTSNTANGFFDALIPALTKVIEWLTKVVDWAGEHRDVIVGFFIAIAAIVTAVYLPAMIAAAAATLAATWPLLAIIAVITAVAAAFALVYEDVMNFIDGNDSLIGQIFEKYPMVKDAVMAIVDVFKLLGSIVAQVWQSLITGFKQVIDFVMTGVKQIASGISSVAGYFGLGDDESPASKGAQPSGSGQDPLDVPGNDSIAMANGAIAAASSSPLNGVSSSAISNGAQTKNSTVEIGQVTVNSQATDAQGVAKDMNSELSSQLKNLEHESATGVSR